MKLIGLSLRNLAWVAAAVVVALPVAAQGQLRSGFVDVEGARLHYRIGGEGQATLFVHGFTNVGNVWDRFIGPWGAERSVIVPDLRGHGLSSNPSGEFTHRLAARDLLSLLDELEVQTVVGIGHSSGAIALLDLALLAPERLTALVLVDGAHRFPDSTRETLAGVDADAMAAALPHFFAAVLEWHPRGMEQLRELAAQIRDVATDPDEGVHSTRALRGLDVPTLIVHGDRDDLYPLSLAVELYSMLPNAELWVMPGVDHGAFLGSQFDPEGERCGPCSAAGDQFPSVVAGFLSRIR